MPAHHIGFYLSVSPDGADSAEGNAMGDTPNHPDRYEIRLRGRLDARWAARFAGMTVRTTSEGTTVIEGPVVDQAALHGLLGMLRDIGLPLLAVNQVLESHPVRFSSEEV